MHKQSLKKTTHRKLDKASPKSRDSECAEKLFRVLPKIAYFASTEMRALANSGASMRQFRLLAKISLLSLTNRQLADAMGVSAPAMSKLVGSLLQQKLVKQVRDETDRREFKISITTKGQAKLEQLTLLMRKLFARKLKSYSENQKAQLSLGLTILEDVFR